LQIFIFIFISNPGSSILPGFEMTFHWFDILRKFFHYPAILLLEQLATVLAEQGWAGALKAGQEFQASVLLLLRFLLP
jgi:hypothetical protein